METDYLYLGPTPAEESCAQVGEPDFNRKSRIEMTAFVNQLYRQFPEANDKNVRFRIKWELHDFGKYGEVVAEYDSTNEDSLNYALNVDWNIPPNWDDEAIEELKEKNGE